MTIPGNDIAQRRRGCVGGLRFLTRFAVAMILVNGVASYRLTPRTPSILSIRVSKSPSFTNSLLLSSQNHRIYSPNPFWNFQLNSHTSADTYATTHSTNRSRHHNSHKPSLLRTIMSVIRYFKVTLKNMLSTIFDPSHSHAKKRHASHQHSPSIGVVGTSESYGHSAVPVREEDKIYALKKLQELEELRSAKKLHDTVSEILHSESNAPRIPLPIHITSEDLINLKLSTIPLKPLKT